MIAIPIVLFVFLVAFTVLMLIFLVGAIISYIGYCRNDGKKIEKDLEEKYGKPKEK